MYDEICAQAKRAMEELLERGKFMPGNIVVVGCSSSEIVGANIGKGSTPEAAAAVAAAIMPIVAQHGGLLAKGRLLGIQFETLFTDGLYFDISRHADAEAMRLNAALRAAGYSFWNSSTTNQQFPILPDALCEKLSKDFSFSNWGRAGTDRIVRFATSWATKPESVDALIEAIK